MSRRENKLVHTRCEFSAPDRQHTNEIELCKHTKRLANTPLPEDAASARAARRTLAYPYETLIVRC